VYVVFTMLPCLPSSAAPPSSWALATSEQSELALSRFQMSRLRLKSVPTETSLESVLAHIATSDLLLGRIASLREAYPELESHILVEQAKTRILQGLSSLEQPSGWRGFSAEAQNEVGGLCQSC
ncbi:hypothetical protein TGCOUG_396410, partial [Toxoplasma gondii COUG]